MGIAFGFFVFSKIIVLTLGWKLKIVIKTKSDRDFLMFFKNTLANFKSLLYDKQHAKRNGYDLRTKEEFKR